MSKPTKTEIHERAVLLSEIMPTSAEPYGKWLKWHELCARTINDYIHLDGPTEWVIDTKVINDFWDTATEPLKRRALGEVDK